MWRYFQPNPYGIETIDCTVRALCAVTGWDWDYAHMVLCDTAREMGTMPSADIAWWAVLKDLGFYRCEMLDQCPHCYTVEDFCLDNPRGVFILGPYEHAVAVINGEYWDSWDSGNTIPTYFFERDELNGVQYGIPGGV